MSKTQQILDLLAKSPDLTVDEIADKTGQQRDKCGALMSAMKGRVVGKTFDGGGNAKRYRLASSPPPKGAGRKGKKPAAKQRHAKRGKKAARPEPAADFRCGMTADRSLLVVNPALAEFREFTAEQTSRLADLLLQHFEA